MHNRSFGKRSAGRLLEDELTSCVFGPLRYMEPSHAWDSCQILFGRRNLVQYLGATPTCVDVRFWPKFPRTDDVGRFVEPDVHILAWVDEALVATILIETKWGASLGESQLLDQWRFIVVDGHEPTDVRARTTHILLSDSPFRALESIEQQKLAADEGRIGWQNRLIALSWYQAAARLATEHSHHNSVETWRNDLVRFFSYHGVTVFSGFQSHQLESVTQVRWDVEAFVRLTLSEVNLLPWAFDGGNAA